MVWNCCFFTLSLQVGKQPWLHGTGPEKHGPRKHPIATRLQLRKPSRIFTLLFNEAAVSPFHRNRQILFTETAAAHIHSSSHVCCQCHSFLLVVVIVIRRIPAATKVTTGWMSILKNLAIPFLSGVGKHTTLSRDSRVHVSTRFLDELSQIFQFLLGGLARSFGTFKV